MPGAKPLGLVSLGGMRSSWMVMVQGLCSGHSFFTPGDAHWGVNPALLGNFSSAWQAGCMVEMSVGGMRHVVVFAASGTAMANALPSGLCPLTPCPLVFGKGTRPLSKEPAQRQAEVSVPVGMQPAASLLGDLRLSSPLKGFVFISKDKKSKDPVGPGTTSTAETVPDPLSGL